MKTKMVCFFKLRNISINISFVLIFLLSFFAVTMFEMHYAMKQIKG